MIILNPCHRIYLVAEQSREKALAREQVIFTIASFAIPASILGSAIMFWNNIIYAFLPVILVITFVALSVAGAKFTSVRLGKKIDKYEPPSSVARGLSDLNKSILKARPDRRQDFANLWQAAVEQCEKTRDNYEPVMLVNKFLDECIEAVEKTNLADARLLKSLDTVEVTEAEAEEIKEKFNIDVFATTALADVVENMNAIQAAAIEFELKSIADNLETNPLA